VWTSNTAPPAGLVGFEGRSSAQPNTYQARMFPQYIDAVRANSIRNWDTKILRRFPIYERLNFMFALDMLNMTNHTQSRAEHLCDQLRGRPAKGQATGRASCSSIRESSSDPGAAARTIKSPPLHELSSHQPGRSATESNTTSGRSVSFKSAGRNFPVRTRAPLRPAACAPATSA
jgi:hypothetical protein